MLYEVITTDGGKDQFLIPLVGLSGEVIQFRGTPGAGTRAGADARARGGAPPARSGVRPG